MASITLKNIPEDLHAIYKRRAKAHSRSLQAEILETLKRRAVPPELEEEKSLDDLVGMLSCDGPPVSVEDMNEAVSKMFRETWK
ncbi:hypothetical protein N9A94_01745 [Akkermansiaceae bacterium]|nr:hypothetical protein [Akkermansiaceae bacterium]MDB4538147.1 hypothetical protein [Akkermansiaceae bacterium]MDB4544549.1 hypothetical protein [Akkermansiaceae bacterium]